jgi:hypothetical protein
MRLKNVKVGISAQCILIFVLTALWWMALFREVFWDIPRVDKIPNILWVGIGYFCPFVLIVFAAILIRSFPKATLSQKWLMGVAELSALSPLVLMGALFLPMIFQ